MKLPSRLNRGDRIGVVSPSAPIDTDELLSRLNSGIRVLNDMGFDVVTAKNALRVRGYSAGTPLEKANDINTMFGDESISAIICSQGGGTANGCLPLLDWKLIQDNPKIFCGFSDISVLLNAIYARTGLVTFHGSDVAWGFGWKPSEYDIAEFTGRLIEGKTGKIAAAGERKTVRGGRAEGRLMGGNIMCLLKLAGTPYWPDFSNAILFMEGYTVGPDDCDYMFNQLMQMGVFDDVRGVIVGHVHSLQTAKHEVMQMEDVLLDVTKDYTFPILKVDDFGHECPNTIIPVGAGGFVDADLREFGISGACVL